MSKPRFSHPWTIWLRTGGLEERVAPSVSRGIRESPLPRSTSLPAAQFQQISPKVPCNFIFALVQTRRCHLLSTWHTSGERRAEPPLSSSLLLFPLSLHNQQRNSPLIALWPAFRDRLRPSLLEVASLRSFVHEQFSEE